jgi:5-methylcytosine-specific restriction protein A
MNRKAYEEVRRRVLARDRYQCQIRLPGICTGEGNTLDHIRPLVEGGSLLDESNCRAACHPCNTRLGAQLGGRRGQNARRRGSRNW